MELEEAIKILKYQLANRNTDVYTPINYEAMEVVLNRLTKQDKMIELMVIELVEQFNHYEPCWLECEDNIKCDNQESCKECIKQYFEKKVEE